MTGGVEIVSAAGAANAVSGTYVLADGLTVFKAEMDATLDLSAADISKDTLFALTGSGKIVFGDDVRILDAVQLQNFSGMIGISSGTLYIPRAADIPASVKFETTGDGLLSFGDAAGFDAATRLSGTANMADGSSGLVITDGNGILEIDNGGILRTVRNIAVGDGGLGDRCGIILGDGTFCSFSTRSPTEEGDGASNAYRNYMKYGDIIAGGAVRVTVRGDFLFDLSTFAGNFITNQSGTRGETVAMAAEGVIGADCVFSCKGEGRSLKGASMAVDGSSVVFSYLSPGFMLLVH